MHQYTADLANRMTRDGHEVHLLTTSRAPLDRYAPGVTAHTPAAIPDTGFSPAALRPRDLRRVLLAGRDLGPDLVHFTGPHLWNPLLLRAFSRAGVPTIHTIHDLHPHAGAAYGRLLYLWNAWVRREAGHLLVHGQRYRQELVAAGVPGSRVTHTPLTHLFLSHDREQALVDSPPEVSYEPWALFIGRLQAYKGLQVLVEAASRLDPRRLGIIIAGPGRLPGLSAGELPTGVDLRNRLVEDEEAIDLFRRCGLVVLPYVEASQSALVAAAHFFAKPVIVTRVGALPEYVEHGETGWIIPPGDALALAERLQAALSDPARLARMGQAGNAWYHRQRSAEAITLRQVYAGLAH
jgi:glycosyltransferase involved in cell wall biosynthesis